LLHDLHASVGASGPHDFAVRQNAARLAPLKRPSHPAPNVRDDAYAPLIEAGRRESVEMICPTAKAKYFCEGDWTTQITLIGQENSVFWRMRREPEIAGRRRVVE
jgi:hypothetical protein